MRCLFSQSALVFPQFWVFEATFEARGQNPLIFKNSVCTFYCTQNDRLDPTVSMQKLVWKTNHPGPRSLQKCFWTWHAKRNCNHILFFLKYLGPGCSVFQINFCIDIVGSRWSFWIQKKGTNRVFINPASLKNQELWENLTWVGKMDFHLGICDS